MENKYLQINNLNNTWVITKRHNGNIFFKRKKYITCLKNCPDRECLFFNEDEVKAEVARLNSTRKKCKYGYENASKYFVNDWYAERWNDYTIKNKAIPIKEVSAKTKLNSFQSVRDTVLKATANDIKDIEDSIIRAQKDLPEAIKRIEQEFKDKIQRYTTQKLSLEIKLNQVSEIDVETVIKPYETQGDKIVKVLYGARNPVLNKQDEVF